MDNSVILTTFVAQTDDLEPLERRLRRVASLEAITETPANFPAAARLYKAVIDLNDPMLPDEMPSVSVTLDMPDDRTAPISPMLERGLIMDVTRTGLGESYAGISDEEFIRQNVPIMREDGPLLYLTNMLYVLRRGLGYTIPRTAHDAMASDPRLPDDSVLGTFRLQISSNETYLHLNAARSLQTILNVQQITASPPHRVYAAIPPTHGIDIPRPTAASLPPGVRKSQDPAVILGTWCNPLVAGCGPFQPSSPDDYAWLKRASLLAYDIGPIQYLVNMLEMLHVTLRQHQTK